MSATFADAASQTMIPVEASRFEAELVSIDSKSGVTFRVAPQRDAANSKEKNAAAAEKQGELRTLKLNELVRWGHPARPRGQTIVLLVDGSRLVAAAEYAGGIPLRLENDVLVVLTQSFDEVRVSKDQVRGIVFAQRSAVEEREKLIDAVCAESSVGGEPAPALKGRGNSETLLLTNGDRLQGKLSALEKGALRFTTDSGEAKLPMSRVEAIQFGQRAGGSAAPRPQGPNNLAPVVVGMRDGSVLYAESVVGNEKSLDLALAGNVKCEHGVLADVEFVQTSGGPFVYLSYLKPAGYRHVPYLNIEWPWQRNRNVTGGWLSVAGKRYLIGIGVHSAARLTYKLDGDFKRFEADIGLDDSSRGRGSVVFAVYLQKDGKWGEAFKSNVVRGGEAPERVSVDVSGAQGLTLTVDYADRGDELDHADWLDARLVKE